MKPKFTYHTHPTLKTITSLQAFIKNDDSLRFTTVKGVDFRDVDIQWDSIEFESTSFLGCQFKHEDIFTLINKGAVLFPSNEKLPYKPYRNQLYSYPELNSLDNGILVDQAIYNHFEFFRYRNNINEALWQRIHDHAIDTCLDELLHAKDENLALKKCIGIMGGHGVLRSSEEFKSCALLCQKLSAAGYYIVSGGGPGIMEAANMGAYFGQYSEEDLLFAISYISAAPYFKDEGYEKLAVDMLDRFPNGTESLAIPTWFYGHEPSNAFSRYIAKYFSNSIREDTLLAIALHGVIFCPGSAGTIQEVFVDAAQNHYNTYDWISPMIFYGQDYYQNKLPVKDLLFALSQNKNYQEKILFTDNEQEIVDFIISNPPEQLGE